MSSQVEPNAEARRASSRASKRSKRYNSDSDSEESAANNSDRPSEGPLKKSAFKSDGVTAEISKHPIDPKVSRIYPGKTCGRYMFREHLPEGFEKEAYYAANRKHAWSIVYSSTQRSNVLDFAKTGNINQHKTAKPARHQTAISAAWQSVCGRFLLYPKANYFLPQEEKNAMLHWFPSNEWQEYLTVQASDEKYNVRNGEFPLTCIRNNCDI
jgi:hypothetical protein